MLKKREEIAIEIESTYNTENAPAATDAILVEDVEFSNEGARMHERAPVKATLGKEQAGYAGSLAKLTFTAEIKGSGAAGTAPEIGKALRACGLGETIVVSTSVAYAPVSSSIESATIYFYQDGRLQKMTGCRGTVEFQLAVESKIVASFEFIGHDAGDSDAALLSGTYDSTVPPPFINAGFDVGGYSAVIAALNLNLGNDIQTPPDANASDGYSEVLIVDRDMQGSFDPEHTLVATQDWYGDWQAGTSKAIDTGVIGSTAGNRIQLAIPTAYYREISQGERSGRRTLAIGFGATGDDSAFTLTFT